MAAHRKRLDAGVAWTVAGPESAAVDSDSGRSSGKTFEFPTRLAPDSVTGTDTVSDTVTVAVTGNCSGVLPVRFAPDTHLARIYAGFTRQQPRILSAAPRQRKLAPCEHSS